MRKQLSSFFLVLFAFIWIAGQASTPVIPLSSDGTKSQLIKSNQNEIALKFQFGDINVVDVPTKKGQFSELNINGTYWTNRIGEPKLPAQRKLIAIPFGADVDVKVLSHSVSNVKLAEFGIDNPIMPLQYDIPKSMDESDIPFEYKANAYAAKSFNESEMASIEVLGTMRGVRIARITVEPVRYNPSNNELEVYNDIEIQVTLDNADWQKTQEVFNSTYSPYFDVAYEPIMNIDGVYEDHPDLLTYPVHMLILADRMFESTLQPFIEWKTQSGFYLTVAYTDEIGSSINEIQSWIHNQYNTGIANGHAPDFMVFVGDTPQIPASATGSSSGKKTDLYYCSVDGDYFPEMYYGRLSAQNTTQLENMLNKIIPYEKYQMSDPAYLDDITLIAGADGTWNPRVGQATIEYGTENYFNTDHGYDDIWVYLSSYGGCYENDRISVGFINYTAHCSETSWGDPSLYISDINSFQNYGKFPLAIGNCCLSGDFATSECIGEAWVRAENRGAIGYIGSSPSSYWFEDFYWSVGAFPISGNNNGYVPTYEETTMGAYDAAWGDSYFCQDALIFVGNLAVTEVDIQGYQQHSSPTYYWQAYNTIGDPSLVPFHTQASVNQVSHDGMLPMGIGQFEVSAEPGSYIALSKDFVLLGTAFVDESGVATVEFDPVMEPGDIDIVVTKPQYIPYITTVPAAALNGPYLTISDFEFDNGSNAAHFSSTAIMDLVLTNLGNDAANNVSITISLNDEHCQLISDATINTSSIEADGNLNINDAFTFEISNDAPDMHLVTLSVQINASSKEIWNQDLSFYIHSPIPLFGNYSIDDSNGGNNNGKFDPGESVDITIQLLNDGHLNSMAGELLVSSTSPFLSFNNANIPAAEIPAQSYIEVTFNVNVGFQTPLGTDVVIDLDYSSGSFSVSSSIEEIVGLIKEDFETGDFLLVDWQFDDDPWEIVGATEAYEGDYAARSSDITNYGISTMYFDYTVTTTGDFSFWYKVSSESTYDYLKFYINGALQDQWSGTVDWTKAIYELEEGDYSFKWEYEKDYSVSHGDDCAWIDLIEFPYDDVLPVFVSVNPETQNIGASEVFTTDIFISNISNLGGFELELNFDADYLQANNVSLGDFLGSTGRTVLPLANTIDNTNGLIEFAITTQGAAPAGADGNGVLLSIEWISTSTITETVVTDLILENLQITQVDGTLVTAEVQNANVTLYLCHETDFDCDCDVDIVDVTSAAYSYGTTVGDPNYIPMYDLDNDNDVDIIDITTVAYEYGWSCGKNDHNQLSYVTENDDVLLSWSEPRQMEANTYEIDLLVENINQLGAYELALDYNIENTTILTIEEGDLIKESGRNTQILRKEINQEEGLVSFAIITLGAQVEGASGDGVLLTVRFVCKDLESVGLNLVNSQILRPDAQIIKHKFKSEQGIELTTAIISTYPSPVKDQMTIKYQIAEDSEISFKIYNMYGALVQNLESQRLNLGNHYLSVEKLNLSTGVYVLYMVQNDKLVDSGKLIVN